MIVVYPMITSKTINPNVLPGICKALEKYVLVYELEDLLKKTNAKIAKSIDAVAEKLVKVTDNKPEHNVSAIE